jgi:hypothetical protein
VKVLASSSAIELACSGDFFSLSDSAFETGVKQFGGWSNERNVGGRFPLSGQEV